MRNPAKIQRGNIWLMLGVNILIPAIVLMKGADILERFRVHASPALVLVVALLFPLAYGLDDFRRRHRTNLFSIIGFASVFVTGGIGLLHLDKEWIAVKEAAVPSVFALAVLATARSQRPLVRMFLLNEDIFDVEKIETELKRRNNRTSFERLMVRCTLVLSFSFMLSATLNFIVARIFIKSPAGTEAFNAELGQMTVWSYPIIAIPCTAFLMVAFWMLARGIRELTGYELEEALRAKPKAPPVN